MASRYDLALGKKEVDPVVLETIVTDWKKESHKGDYRELISKALSGQTFEPLKINYRVFRILLNGDRDLIDQKFDIDLPKPDEKGGIYGSITINTEDPRYHGTLLVDLFYSSGVKIMESERIAVNVDSGESGLNLAYSLRF
jgi:hypothetical protein